MRRFIIFLTAAIWGLSEAAAYSDGPVRWVDTAAFVGTRFTFNGEACQSGVFGDEVTGTLCTGDPWAVTTP